MPSKRVVCKKCGNCCNTVKGIPLSQKEASKLSRGKIVSSGKPQIRSIGGVCALLNRRLCAEYANRPSKCRQYPFAFINGKAILEINCSSMRELHVRGETMLTRAEIEKIPFLKKALLELEKENPLVRVQNKFVITDR